MTTETAPGAENLVVTKWRLLDAFGLGVLLSQRGATFLDH